MIGKSVTSTRVAMSSFSLRVVLPLQATTSTLLMMAVICYCRPTVAFGGIDVTPRPQRQQQHDRCRHHEQAPPIATRSRQQVGRRPAAEARWPRTTRCCSESYCRQPYVAASRVQLIRLQMGDDWSGFAAIDDDDDDILGTAIDTTDYAKEDDDQQVKAEIGSYVDPPSIEQPAEPIFLPAGT